VATSEPCGIADVLDLVSYPIDDPTLPRYRSLVDRCRASLRADGLFDLPDFVRADMLESVVADLRPAMEASSFRHRRAHNIYFLDEVPGVAADHPVLRLMETSNRTLCGDQLVESPLSAAYRWAPLRQFIAETIGIAELFVMDDPLACLNVMSYQDGEALNWHFDRAEFTTTIMLQRPVSGGVFEYRTGLRATPEADHDAVGRLVEGTDPHVRRHDPGPGTLTVFAGRSTAHRVTPVGGPRDRLVAVCAYVERPGMSLTATERHGFYGRSEPLS
jgi:hypothetical protein